MVQRESRCHLAHSCLSVQWWAVTCRVYWQWLPVLILFGALRLSYPEETVPSEHPAAAPRHTWITCLHCHVMGSEHCSLFGWIFMDHQLTNLRQHYKFYYLESRGWQEKSRQLVNRPWFRLKHRGASVPETGLVRFKKNDGWLCAFFKCT